MVALRIGVVAASCLGIWSSWKLAKADRLFHRDSKESIRAALRLEPDAWEYSMRLAQLDDQDARQLLESAVRISPYNAPADIELGLDFEAAGDYTRAEKFLQDAYGVDHTFLPRWSLANFYFRRGNIPAFWTWAKSAAQLPSGTVNLRPLFELCWHVSPNPEQISALVVDNDPNVIGQYLSFLSWKGQLKAAAALAPRLIRNGQASDNRWLLFSFVDKLIAAGDQAAAKELWGQLIQAGWVIADSTVPNNADFAREPLPVSFDWRLPDYTGLHSWPGPSGLEVEFTGDQPEHCLIAEQTLALTPGAYSFSYSYRTAEIPPGTGVHWQIVDAATNQVLATSVDLSSDTLTNSAVTFTVSPSVPFVRLRLTYQRSLGTTRISGSLTVRSTRVEGVQSSSLVPDAAVSALGTMYTKPSMAKVHPNMSIRANGKSTHA